MNRTLSAATTASLVSLISVLQAGNWPQWRGPNLNGSCDETGLPETFNPTENVRWVLDMPGPGSSTPIVWGKRIFVTSVGKDAAVLAMCVDTETGAVLWTHEADRNRRVPNNTMATPSAVTDGKTVCFAFGTGLLMAFTVDGEKLWERDLGKEYGYHAFMFGYSSSPLLLDGRIYQPAIRNPRPDQYKNQFPKEASRNPVDSYLLCAELATGKTVWKVTRESDAQGETVESYVTPIPLVRDNRTEILLFGADYLTAHNADTGEETWRWSGYNPTKINHWRVVPSALVGDGLVYVAAPKHAPLYAIRPADSGHVTDSHVAWTLERLSPDASTPLLYRGRLYVLQDDRRIISCLDPKTGSSLWQGELGGRAVIRASLTGADGRIYGINEAGEAFVVSAGDEFKLLHTVSMGQGGPCRATISAANGSLFIRTADKLFCIGK